MAKHLGKVGDALARKGKNPFTTAAAKAREKKPQPKKR